MLADFNIPVFTFISREMSMQVVCFNKLVRWTGGILTWERIQRVIRLQLAFGPHQVEFPPFLLHSHTWYGR